MSELAVRPNGWGVLDHTQPAPAPARQDLATWVEQAREVAGIADMLCRTSFVPKAFQGKPAECAAAILAGQEMDMAPMASLRAIDVIEGKPGLSALAMRALVQSKGHDIWVHESTATRAIVKGKRRGSDNVESSTWTIERAKTFGLTGKKNWREQPTAMLLARATSECARLIAADVLLGMPYSAEELADGADAPADAAPAAEAKPARRTARRAQPPAAPEPQVAPAGPDPQWSEPAAESVPVDDEPDFDDDQPATAPTGEPEAVPMIIDAQQRKMHALFREVDVTDRDERMRYASEVLGREIGSSKELTRQEAGQVIDALERWAQASQPTAEEVADVTGEQR